MTDFLLKSTSARNVRVGDTIRTQLDDDEYEYMLVISREEFLHGSPKIRFEFRNAKGKVLAQNVPADSPAFVKIEMAPAELDVIELPRTNHVFARGSIRAVTPLEVDRFDNHRHTFEVIGIGFRQLIVVKFTPDYEEFQRAYPENDARIEAVAEWLRNASSEWYEECKRLIFGSAPKQPAPVTSTAQLRDEYGTPITMMLQMQAVYSVPNHGHMPEHFKDQVFYKWQLINEKNVNSLAQLQFDVVKADEFAKNNNLKIVKHHPIN